MNVADYYDANTKRFIKTGSGSGEMAIHRPVWAMDVASRSEAIHYVDSLIVKSLYSSDARGVIDLGCGVGGSLAYLAARYNARYFGITISGIQADIGKRLLNNKPHMDKNAIVLGDMTDEEQLLRLRSSLPSPVMFYCIESFLHVDDGGKFLYSLARAMRKGDTFAICDDFLTCKCNRRSDRNIMREFSAGWKAPSLMDIEDFQHASLLAGLQLVNHVDLSPFLKLWRAPNIAIRVLVDTLRPFHPKGGWWDNFIGGNALQRGLHRGIFSYRFLRFEKR